MRSLVCGCKCGQMIMVVQHIQFLKLVSISSRNKSSRSLMHSLAKDWCENKGST